MTCNFILLISLYSLIEGGILSFFNGFICAIIVLVRLDVHGILTIVIRNILFILITNKSSYLSFLNPFMDIHRGFFIFLIIFCNETHHFRSIYFIIDQVILILTLLITILKEFISFIHQFLFSFCYFDLNRIHLIIKLFCYLPITIYI